MSLLSSQRRSVRFNTLSVLFRIGTANSCATNDRTGLRRPFDDPIEVGSRKLVTLRDAREHIAALPKKEHDTPAQSSITSSHFRQDTPQGYRTSFAAETT
ncbi:hypothetical protein QA649_09610 [Bradyrhizobium sp. CB1717]|uniref:hypothetical protein n=1 Tax=Bradyrhizobium sp. CB1717 TaxID=3039154 RepID=UPI0024B1C39B|nr:hypothetical protein [Bradyrhizobium sp. CB1717]WFU26442.1 hypothetical protein QA649_09610 [Bradyrhizobium sp. CB1717]